VASLAGKVVSCFKFGAIRLMVENVKIIAFVLRVKSIFVPSGDQ